MSRWSLFCLKPAPRPPLRRASYGRCGTLAIRRALEEPPPDPDARDTLGWRCWRWDEDKGRLVCPIRGTVWERPELYADNWSDEAGLTGQAGIEARLVPLHWPWAWAPMDVCGPPGVRMVTGIVERFGRYVLGTRGWRAEWAVIRELAAEQAIGERLSIAYPEAGLVLQPGPL